MNEYSYELWSKIFMACDYTFTNTYIVKGNSAEEALTKAKADSEKWWNYYQIKNFQMVSCQCRLKKA